MIVDNVLAVTMKFESISLQGSRADPASYLNAYDRWFRTQLIRSIGNNLGRKRHLQPLSYAFVDFPGSRGQSIANPTASYDLLHIHAVVAIRPGPGQVCRLPFLVAGSAHADPDFGDVKVTPFDPSLGSLENMVGYFKKGSDAVGRFCRSDCFDVFPRFKVVRTRVMALT